MCGPAISTSNHNDLTILIKNDLPKVIKYRKNSVMHRTFIWCLQMLHIFGSNKP